MTQVKGEVMHLAELKQKSIADLNEVARDLKIEGAANLRKQELIFAILQAQTEKNGVVFGEGVLETLPDGFGFLRAPDSNYLPGQMIFISRRHRFADSISELGILCQARFGHRRRASAILPCSR